MMKNNEAVPMTRRYPNLSGKVLRRDSEIVKKIIAVQDSHNGDLVFEIYMKEQKNLSDERYWELLRTVWILSGNMERVQLFRKLMQSTRKQRFYFSTPEEAKFLRELPSELSVHRATNDSADGGLSWTLSHEYAVKYQQMFQKKIIISRLIDKSTVFAYIERNNESEILIL
jgi:hypothetical protein